MALFTIDHFAKSLRLNMQCLVSIPENAPGMVGIDSKGDTGEDGKYPTLWLLHGGTDNHTIWLRRTGIERYTNPLGMAVVMPNVHLSRYANMVYGGNYWDYLTEELPEMLERWLPIANTPQKRYVAGLSMGGWGTFKWALNYPERFAAAACLSGAIHLDYEEWKGFRSRISSDKPDLVYGGAEDDFPYPEDRLKERVKENLGKNAAFPKLFSCCGTEDFLIECNRKGIASLRELGLDIHYEEGPGAHTWDFWDAWIQRALQWMGFDITPPELGNEVK